MKTVHIPVLFDEVMDMLGITRGGRFLDCTVGGAGHLEGILKRSEKVEVVGLDRDSRAIDRAKVRLQPFEGRYQLMHIPFSRALEVEHLGPFQGVLADFGLSTDQLKEARGLSFQDDAPLDMRMNEEDELSAEDIVNHYPPQELMKILRRGGVRRNVKRYAGAIIDNRPHDSAKEFAEVIKNATPIGDRKNTHPATTVFQALRIAVNDELREIEVLLDTLPRLVAPGGRSVCISFHSLEDQLVASRFRKWEGHRGPAGWPGAESLGEPSLGKHLTKQAIVPTKEETADNPSSRSALMRVFEFSSEGFSSEGKEK